MADRHVRLPAVVLAGAPATDEERSKYSVEHRAAIPIGGKPMVRHVVDALKASSRVWDICLVGDIQCEGIIKVVPSAGNIMENLVAGVKACASADGGHVLVATSDIPMVTPAAIDDFIERCGDLSADFYYPVIPKKACEERFPEMRRTCARLAEGTFTGGNVVVMRSGFLLGNAGLICRVLDARKSVARLAKLIGLSVLVRAIMAQTVWAGAIDLASLERTVGCILNATVRVVQSPHPEIGADVDDIEQVELAERLLAGGGE